MVVGVTKRSSIEVMNLGDIFSPIMRF